MFPASLYAMSATHTLPDLSAVRVIKDGDTVWYSLADIADAAHAQFPTMELVRIYDSLPFEHRRERQLFSPSGASEQGPVVSVEGVVAVLAQSTDPGLVALRLVFLESSVRQALHRSSGGPLRATPWGEQPIRQVLRDKGLSVARFTVLLNAAPFPSVFRAATVSAVVLGRQLPSLDLADAAQYVLQVPRGELFSAEVLERQAKRYGSPQAAPVVPEPSESAYRFVGMSDLVPSDGVEGSEALPELLEFPARFQVSPSSPTPLSPVDPESRTPDEDDALIEAAFAELLSTPVEDSDTEAGTSD
jgi:hypothetical protein